MELDTHAAVAAVGPAATRPAPQSVPLSSEILHSAECSHVAELE
jgi:hypothetical protein